MNIKNVLNRLDYQIALAIALCLVLSYYMNWIQATTACITVLLVTQDKTAISLKVGLTRLLITVIGGCFGIAVVLADNMMLNKPLFVLMVIAGTLLTIGGCKMAKVPYISTRIGAVTFVLVTMIGDGEFRVKYAVFRVISTVIGVLAVMAVGKIAGILDRKATAAA